MNTVKEEVSELESIVLTKNGVVVGYVEVEKFNDAIGFLGRSVNIKWGLGSLNSFASTSSISAESADEISSEINFLYAINKAGK